MVKSMDRCEQHTLNFSMPYLNGKLHLGHAYLITQGDAKLRLSNLLFKTKSVYMFPFHATGMPILQRLKALHENDEKVISEFSDILNTLNIKKELKEISLTQWLDIFEQYIKTSVNRLNTTIDWRYSHKTTDLQKNYSSFVTWYFKLLYEKNLIYKGSHSVIWCNDCNLVLGDHERKKGEGVYIEERSFISVKYNDLNLLVLNSDNKSSKIYQPINCIFYKININGIELITTNYIFDQIKNIYCIKGEKIDIIFDFEKIDCTSFVNSEKHKTNIDIGNYKFQIFSSPVVCRYNHIGTIKQLSDQWFIKYSDKIWKDKTKEIILSLQIKENYKEELLNRLNEIQDWVFTRETGLGTTFYLDNTKIIEPLSDSTLYMVFSYIKPYLKNIFYEIEFWNYVTGISKTVDKEIKLKHPEIKIIKDKLTNWNNKYHTTVSAKDLIPNHILFCCFAQAISNFIIDEFLITGYILFNKQKLSKSKGSLLQFTPDLKYDPEVLRLTFLTMTSPGEDGNFEETKFNISEKSIKDLEKYLDSISSYLQPNNFFYNLLDFRSELDLLFENELKKIKYKIFEYYDTNDFRNIFNYTRYKLVNLIDYYLKMNGTNKSLIRDIVRTQISILSIYMPNKMKQLSYKYNIDIKGFTKPLVNINLNLKDVIKLKIDINKFTKSKKISQLYITSNNEFIYDILNNIQIKDYLSKSEFEIIPILEKNIPGKYKYVKFNLSNGI